MKVPVTVSETDFSRYHGAPFDGALEPPKHRSTIRYLTVSHYAKIRQSLKQSMKILPSVTLQTVKTTTVGRGAVRETDVRRPHGGPIDGAPGTS